MTDTREEPTRTVWLARYPCRVHLDPRCPVALAAGARPGVGRPLDEHGRMWQTPHGPLLVHRACAAAPGVQA
jgi:hypothetical protein